MGCIMTFLIFQTRSDENKLQLSKVKTFTPVQKERKNSFYQTSWCRPEYTDYLTIHINTGYSKFRNLALLFLNHQNILFMYISGN